MEPLHHHKEIPAYACVHRCTQDHSVKLITTHVEIIHVLIMEFVQLLDLHTLVNVCQDILDQLVQSVIIILNIMN